jgi:hypothetical protein
MEETQLSKRLKQIQKHYDSLVELEDLYYKVAHDYGMISDEIIKSISQTQSKKRELKGKEFKSMAEFEREYELSEEYLILKSCKYQLRAYERVMSGLKVRIESLKAGEKGHY